MPDENFPTSVRRYFISIDSLCWNNNVSVSAVVGCDSRTRYFSNMVTRSWVRVPTKTHFLSCRRGRPVASPGYKWDVRVTMPILASGRGRVAEGSISGYEAGRVLGGTSYPSISLHVPYSWNAE